MKKFSFVVPTYQNKRMVKNTLASLNNQKGYDREDYEVILVDDGSTDGTKEYIQGVNENYDLQYLYLERSSDSCRARARNKGWQEATGEIVLFIDGDILVKEDYLQEIDRCMSKSENMLVIGTVIMLLEDTPYEMIGDREAFREKICQVTNFVQLFDPRYFIYYKFSYNNGNQLYPWLHVYGSNLAVKKKWLEETGGFDEDLKKWGHEDIELGYRMYQKGVKIVVSSKLEVYHQFQWTLAEALAHRNTVAKSKENIEYLLKKHPNAIHAPKAAVYSFFRGVFAIDLVPKQRIFWKRTVLEFRNIEDLERIKKTITALSKERGNKIIVKDFVEASDLDIWIQLQEKSPSIPRYYPISKIAVYKKFMGYRIAVFHLKYLYGRLVRNAWNIRQRKKD